MLYHYYWRSTRNEPRLRFPWAILVVRATEGGPVASFRRRETAIGEVGRMGTALLRIVGECCSAVGWGGVIEASAACR